MTVEVNKQTLGFQSEVKQLLDLMIHSLYSNREIFLRELVSNASDAADRLRFAALSNDALYEEDPELKIEVDYSKTQGTITVRDNGIGMTREEVIDQLGTIAKSGTREFFSNLTGDQQRDAELIGQFGVGFYSSFIVAERVTVSTRKAGVPEEQGVRWESDGQGEYTVHTIPRKRRGTEVVLHLRKDHQDLADGFRLRDIVHRYSDHISLPIRMPKQGEAVSGFETVNKATALWTRNKNEISDEDYNEFYKHIAHDFESPLARIHNRVEGKLEYTSLFFIPSRAPFDLWDRDARHGLKLYVRRVFITQGDGEFLPRYLRFVRGIIDSNDLPLNVSREMLQQNKVLDAIRAASVKRILGLLEEMVEKRPEDYAKFWREFGRVLKEGIIEDPGNRERIVKLARFSSTLEDKREHDVALDGYVERMRSEQKYIYYLVADSFETAKSSPHLEVLRDKGIEVLLLFDPVDEWVVAHLHEFRGKELKSVARGEFDAGELGTAEAEEREAIGEQDLDGLIKAIRDALGDDVKDVRPTDRLTNSPACLVADESDLGMNLQRILKATGQQFEGAKPILEVNLRHPLVTRLKREQEGGRFGDWVRMLFEQALLSEGGRLDDPAAFVRRLNALLLDLAS
jgi:molecular chaperone HtpG